MSHCTLLIENINTAVTGFCKEISSTYDIKYEELVNIWNNDNYTKNKSDNSIKKIKEGPYEQVSDILVATTAVLKSMCKKHGLKQSGKKDELINRLLNKPEDTPVEKPVKKIQNKNLKEDNIQVIKKMKSEVSSFRLRKNKWGNIWHQETSLVFDPDSEKVYCKQLEDGTTVNLSPDDIETCNKYKFSYDIPENLDEGKNVLDEINIEEVDDEDNDDEDYVIEEEIIESDDDYDDDEEIIEEEIEYYEE